MMFMTGDGQALFLRRAGDGDHLGEWGFPGGNAEDAETPLECLMRETQEETGHDCAGHDDIISAVDHSFSDTGQYLTFGHLVDAPFEPKLNEEHSEHVWRPIDDPPEPLHPGVRATLDKVGDAARKATAVPVGPREVPADAGTSEGARKAAERRNHAKHADLHGELGGKASGFEQDKHYQASGAHSSAANYKGAFGEPRWQALSERAHKASEALGIQSRLPDAQRVLAGDMLAFDRGLEKRSYDENGHLHVAESNLTKCTVSPYMGEEIPDAEKLGLDPKKKYQLLRAQDELEKPETIASFNGKPVLFQHKMATAVDFPTGLTIGSTGTEAKYEHPYLKNSLSIWPEYASQAVEAGDKSQLSAGYSYTADMTPGIHDGTPYDGVMRNIRGQHIAIVNEGRSGPDVRVEDSSIEDKQWMLIEEALAAL
jgi:8-oxo-dGTP pyrophosphatase MutT (NUDIX family)